MQNPDACTDLPDEPPTYEEMLAQIARVAFADVRGLFNPDGSVKPIAEIDDDLALALSVEIEEGSAKRSAKLKLDRQAALALYAKYAFDGQAGSNTSGSALSEAEQMEADYEAAQAHLL